MVVVHVCDAVVYARGEEPAQAKVVLCGSLAVDHDLENEAAVLVSPAGHERECIRRALEREAVRDELGDSGERARAKERQRLRVRARVAERAVDVDLAERGGGEREHDVARAHADEHNLAARLRCVDGQLDARARSRARRLRSRVRVRAPPPMWRAAGQREGRARRVRSPRAQQTQDGPG
jgi:hypothetical protein